MEIAIVLFIYKRPELSQQITQRIIDANPACFYLFSDGPKDESDKSLIEETRRKVESKIPNGISLVKKYRKSNVGLSKNIIEGLNEVFQSYEAAIILEDDCLPEADFFNFCFAALKKYKDKPQIMHIGGSLIIESQKEDKPIKSRFTLPSWGWACWKDSWMKFNQNFDTYSKKKGKITEKINIKNLETFTKALSSLKAGNYNSWDIQWMVDVWDNNGYAILPPKNLIQNLGDDEASIHTPTNSSFLKRAVTNTSLNIEKVFTQNPVDLDDQIESKVALLLEEFITHNKGKNSISKQLINYIEPSQISYPLNSIKELKEALFPLPKMTLLPKRFFHDFIDYFKFEPVIKEHAWFQAGCWKGGSSLFLASFMRDISNKNKLYMVDTFGNIPTSTLSKQRDIEFVEAFDIKPPIKSYFKEVENLLEKFELRQNTDIINTEINDLNEKELPLFSLAFIDLDFYEPTLTCLEKIYKHIVPEGYLLVDDYYSLLFNCSDAVNDFFKVKIKSGEVSFHPFNENILLIKKHV